MNKKEKTIKSTELKREKSKKLEKIKKEVKRDYTYSTSSYNNSTINTRKCSNITYNRK